MWKRLFGKKKSNIAPKTDDDLVVDEYVKEVSKGGPRNGIKIHHFSDNNYYNIEYPLDLISYVTPQYDASWELVEKHVKISGAPVPMANRNFKYCVFWSIPNSNFPPNNGYFPCLATSFREYAYEQASILLRNGLCAWVQIMPMTYISNQRQVREEKRLPSKVYDAVQEARIMRNNRKRDYEKRTQELTADQFHNGIYPFLDVPVVPSNLLFVAAIAYTVFSGISAILLLPFSLIASAFRRILAAWAKCTSWVKRK